MVTLWTTMLEIQKFNILYGSQNKQRLFPYTTLTVFFLFLRCVFRCATRWIFKNLHQSSRLTVVFKRPCPASGSSIPCQSIYDLWQTSGIGTDFSPRTSISPSQYNSTKTVELICIFTPLLKEGPADEVWEPLKKCIFSSQRALERKLLARSFRL